MTATKATASGSDLVKCSFCGKSQKEVKKLVAGPGVYICDECLDLCNQMVAIDGPPLLTDDLVPRSVDELIGVMVRLHSSHQAVDNNVQRVVRELRSRGVSWAGIGDSLGMTKQSAWERFSGED